MAGHSDTSYVEHLVRILYDNSCSVINFTLFYLPELPLNSFSYVTSVCYLVSRAV